MADDKFICQKLYIFVLFINFFGLGVPLHSNFHSKQCTHQYPKAHEVVHGAYIDPPHVIRKRSIDQPLRILLWYDDSVYRLDNERFALINSTILPKAVSFWEKALMVRKSENVIRLNRKCDHPQVFVRKYLTHCIDSCRAKTMCGEVEVPEAHLDVCRVCNATGQNCREDPNSVAGPGIDNADFLFYVSAMQTTRCNKGLTVAYAAHCQQEIALDRPIAGYANFCPESINTKPQELETLLSTVKHEILHALGFSASLYGFYRDSEGRPLTTRKQDTGRPPLNETLQMHQWSDKVIKTVERKAWLVRGGSMKRTVHMVVTPRVVKEVRNYFHCDKLEGAELEDQGGDGTALTHWEKRVFENEAMTGTHTQNPVISRISLALMEDTGWYKANYWMAESMSWGRGLGCDFVMKSCKEWMAIKSAKGRSIHPFCNKVKRDPLQTECTEDRTSVALCNLAEHDQELPAIYQNFDYIQHVESGQESFYGGSVSLADYCPYIQEFTWRSKNITIRGSQCQYEDNTPHLDKNFALESYGEKSLCFDHTNQMWEERSCGQVRQWRHWGSGCYRYNCDGGRLNIIVGNYSYTCYYPGQEITIRIVRDEWLHKGAILCPRCQELCGTELYKIGKQCKGSEEAPPATQYPRDELKCNGCVKSTIVSFCYYVILLIIINQGFYIPS
ncbi:leishmanolysin-like peptidase isoform X2 [Chrysoperla carnea]|uniref:leishmanolysin-like peptidase isoform X2 n=1 Tax=Chrysoperla carnea TaxID=189513 RepID=UPI001D072E2D|nr:leishmanolysin-like peptidase isoform X2 [Chrysoperla carnea]